MASITLRAEKGLALTIAEVDANFTALNNAKLEAVAPVVAVPALAIDCSAGSYFTKTIGANSTFTFTNVPATGCYGFTLELTHTSGTVTWPAAVKWPGDTAPNLTTGRVHLFMFVTDDGGTRFRGGALTDYVS